MAPSGAIFFRASIGENEEDTMSLEWNKNGLTDRDRGTIHLKLALHHLIASGLCERDVRHMINQNMERELKSRGISPMHPTTKEAT